MEPLLPAFEKGDPPVSNFRARLSHFRHRARSAVARRLRRGHRSQPNATGVLPTVVEERTHVGPAFDAIVTRMKQQQEPIGRDADYDLLRENFDHHHFALFAENLHDRRDADPVRIFLNNGARAAYSPDPHFSMKNYLERHPERDHKREDQPYVAWLREGRAAGEIADPAFGIDLLSPVLGMSPGEIVDELVETRTDVMQRLRNGTLGEMFAKAAEIEPLIAPVWQETARTRLVPLASKPVAISMHAIHACHEQAGFRRARLVLVSSSAGCRPLTRLVRALSAQMDPADIVVIHTESGAPVPGTELPDGVRVLDFATVTQGLGSDRPEALVALLRSFHSEAIVGFDSSTLHEAMGPYGKALAASERVFLCFAAEARNVRGQLTGHALTSFYSSFALVEAAVTDSGSVHARLTERYQLSDADLTRLHLLRSPVDPEIAVAPVPKDDPGRRPVVAWQGSPRPRGCFDLAAEVAKQIPEADFWLWADPGWGGETPPDWPENLRVREMTGGVETLELGATDLWCSMDPSDLVPDRILDLAMTQVPVMAVRSVGTQEVLSERDAWLIEPGADPAIWAERIREVLADPKTARERAQQLRERLVLERPAEPYGAAAAALLLRPEAEESR